jgi:hypothetical protein
MYTPQFSDSASVSVRRLAWALKTTMPATVNRMVNLLPAVFDPGLVCRRCRDKTKCRICVFSRPVSEQEKQSLAAM